MAYQLTCPKCHYEFQYDNGKIDAEIARLGVEISDMHYQFAQYKAMDERKKKEREQWYMRAKTAFSYKQKRISELKALRKVTDQQIKAYEHDVFKDLVKEAVGEKLYMELVEKTKKELEAYRISGLMRHEYTRSGSKANVTSINKL